MSQHRPENGAPPPEERFRQRCAALAVPTRRYGGDGVLESVGTGEHVVFELASTHALAGPIDAAAAAWMDVDVPEPFEIAPGFWIGAVEERGRRQRRSLTVTLLLGPAALESPLLAQAAAELGRDAAALRDPLAPIASHTRGSVEHALDMLRCMHDDLRDLEQSERFVGLFGQQLSESYEEISLLYKLGRSMNEIAQPQRFVRFICRELGETLPYGWICAWFVEGHPMTRLVPSRAFSAGNAPSSGRSLHHLLEQLARETDGTDAVVVDAERAAVIGGGSGHVLVQPIAVDGEVVGALLAGDKQGDDVAANGVDMKMLEAASGYASVILQNASLYDEQQAMFIGTIEALTSAIDAKDPYTRGHSQRVAHLAYRLSLASELSESEAERVRIAGLVHDVGKIGVPEAVLRKTGRLTESEYEEIKRHPEIGHHILRDIPRLEDVLPGVMHHHERYDGGGYPTGLSGQRIPLVARIIGLVDAFDAMSSNRTYRPAMPRRRVLEEIRRGAGSQFDPWLADRFLTIDLTDYDAMVDRHHREVRRGTERPEAA